MSSHQPAKLSILGKAHVYFIRLRVVLLMLRLAARRRFSGIDAHQSILKTFAICFLTAGRIILPEEVWRRSLRPQTGVALKKYCTSQKASVRSVPLDTQPPSTLHFIDPYPPGRSEKKDKRVLFYLHGGGYIQPITAPGHMSFALDCAKAAKSMLVILEYTLAPDLQYPGQLVQAVHALRYLLNDYQPSDIILGGDSAGGNLVLALLAHIKRTSPYAPSINLEGKRFRGAYLISPWVGLDYTADSYVRNNGLDFITRDPQMYRATKLWGPKKEDIYCNQLDGSADFWKDVIDSEVDKVQITTGTREVFFDDIVEIAGKMGAEESKDARVQLIKCDKEVHTSCLLDSAMKIKGGGMSTAILEWLKKTVPN